MRSRRWFFFLFLILMLVMSKPPVLAVSSPEVLIIDIPRLTLDDITTYSPNMLKLLNNSTVGIMTTPLSDPITLDQVYFSFNSGVQLKTIEENYLLFNVSEEYKAVPAGGLYQSLTGIKAPKDGVVHVGLGKIALQNNKELSPNIGLLGKLLHQNTVKTAAIGNADADLINRCGALLFIDNRGQIDYGAIGEETTVNDPKFPFGLRTNNDQVFSIWQDFSKKAQAVVISLGDLDRIDRFNPYMSNSQWKYYRQAVLKNYDQLIDRILKEVDEKNTLIIVFTGLPPSRNAETGDRLSPVLIKGPGFGKGLIYSISTRRPGILTCYDLPATLLHFLKVPSYNYFHGHILKQVPGDWHTIAAEQAQLITNYKVRWPLLTVYGYLLIGLILIGLAGAVFWPEKRLLFKWIAEGYLFLLTIPAVFLIEAIINPLSWPEILGWTIGLAGVFWLGAYFISGKNQLGTLGIISLVTIGMIVFDGLLNGFFELKSFFGYSAIAGARFYGIGNEYMGFLLGAYVVLGAIFLQKLTRFKKETLWFTASLITVLLIHPDFGASIGGGITALIGLGITNYLWLDQPIRWREILRLLVAVILLLLLIGLWDFYFNKNNMSHFGQFVSTIKNHHFNMIWELINRKFGLNIRLIAYTPWADILIAILVITPLVYKRPSKTVVELITKYPYQLKGFVGLNLMAIVALLVNDSGIVTVTTMFIFGTIMLLLVILKEWTAKRSG